MSIFSAAPRRIPFDQLDLTQVITSRLDYTIYTDEQIRAIKNAAYARNFIDGHYKTHWRGHGPDNPSLVGQEDHCDTLVYVRETNAWLLTDGLGNGVVR